MDWYRIVGLLLMLAALYLLFKDREEPVEEKDLQYFND